MKDKKTFHNELKIGIFHYLEKKKTKNKFAEINKENIFPELYRHNFPGLKENFQGVNNTELHP